MLTKKSHLKEERCSKNKYKFEIEASKQFLSIKTLYLQSYYKFILSKNEIFCLFKILKRRLFTFSFSWVIYNKPSGEADERAV